ncbi:DUF6228 family protein [Streptomyces sp. NPDC060232]|uniref:DUF6228 family protein n=1 Tax=Streptomyces sp. NPDC060232 TaxID=3347079 RepID=UPI003654430C
MDPALAATWNEAQPVGYVWLQGDTEDDGFRDGPCVAVRCQDNSSVAVSLHDRHSPDDHGVHHAVEVRAPGLRARLDQAVARIGDGRDLAPFLERLAADHTGWDGERRGKTNDGDLTVSAVFRPGGYVGSTWTLRPWRPAAGAWSATVNTQLEAGEQMESFAADIRHYLEDRRPR